MRRMGGLSAAAVVCVLSGAAPLAAQEPRPAPSPPPQQTPAALSVPDPLAGFRPGPRDLYQAPDGSDRFQHLPPRPASPPIVVFPGTYIPGPYGLPHLSPPYADPSASRTHGWTTRATVPRGALVLEGLPDAAQVYVDGYYVGPAMEFGTNGHPMDLEPGRHHVEVRANGYETLSFAVMIHPLDILRFRGDMERRAAAAAPTIAPPSPRRAVPTYVIPKCYAGDKPPSSPLPEGCDVKRLKIVK